MLVVVHDFAPVFVRELSTIVTALLPIVGQQLSVAVVPCWQGSSSGNRDEGYRELLGVARERLLHGWTHQSRDSWRPVSLLTKRADEFRGLDATTIRERIRLAQTEFTELTGEVAQGLLPPAWQLPIRSTELGSLRFVMRFRGLESCRDSHHVRPLVTWSWDWGRLGWLSRGGELIGTLLSCRNPTAIPCIAIHPADVRRGCLPHAVRVIRQLIDSGYEPTTATELMLDSVPMSAGAGSEPTQEPLTPGPSPRKAGARGEFAEGAVVNWWSPQENTVKQVL